MFKAPSQLLERHLTQLNNKSTLILNIEHDTFADELKKYTTHCESLALDYQHYQCVEPYSDTHEFGVTRKKHQANQFEHIILYYPKAKSLADYLFHLAAFYLKKGGSLWVVGENKSGIRGLKKQLPKCFDAPFKLDNARHCLLFETTLKQDVETFLIDDWQTTISVETPMGSFDVCMLPGVFSQKKLDRGTEFLLEHLPDLKGHILDFGCGAGVITCAILKKNPQATLDAVDINAMALEACQRTLAANDLSAQVYPSNGLSQTQKMYNAIISNPPFHDGLAKTTLVTEQFIKDSFHKIKPNGLWQVVVNQHLDYAHTIEKHFGNVNILAKNNHFKIFQQTKKAAR